MYIYHLSDSRGWYDRSIYLTEKEAIAAAEHFMNRPAWEQTDTLTIHRMDTRTQEVKEIAVTIHGAHRSETYDLQF